jgi:Asp-tRNA(Asn)/Glu-tRNA(Gln) amidotransferase A subunit family amidase
MARTVADAVAVFQVIAGEDPNDPVTARSRGRQIPNYADSLDASGLRGARIGVLRQAWSRGNREDIDDEVRAVFMQALDDLRAAGAEIVDPADVDFSGVQRARGAGSCMGFKYDINQYLASHGDRIPMKTLEEIVESNRYHPSIQSRLRGALEGDPEGPDSEACQADDAYRAAYGEAIAKTMDALRLDAYVYPTWSYPPRLIGDLNTPHGDNSQVFSPRSGFPALQVPMGYTRDNTLPAGLTIFGRAWDEARLIRLAFAYEQATRHRRPPPTTPGLR